MEPSYFKQLKPSVKTRNTTTRCTPHWKHCWSIKWFMAWSERWNHSEIWSMSWMGRWICGMLRHVPEGNSTLVWSLAKWWKMVSVGQYPLSLSKREQTLSKYCPIPGMAIVQSGHESKPKLVQKFKILKIVWEGLVICRSDASKPSFNATVALVLDNNKMQQQMFQSQSKKSFKKWEKQKQSLQQSSRQG